ncbi:microtubule-associated tumor suppressor 1 homolog A isoform X2 [Fundulus heteroclitus]|uniref:microtubule-associated tumor suppressor 1 homolog A isoform X2 n=1 Tax=Fundulus heteroclitus TaxID=8078 RepID=UPI00165C6DFB|nr:microtubule-associated tumor suppressor 1 homolog A isoform X2 [Fundulus heteroclitus]
MERGLMDSQGNQACSTNMMDYSAVSGRRFSSELESHRDSEMAEPFNLPSVPFKRAALTPQGDRRFPASPDSDGTSSQSEREARGSPYINTDHGLNEQSSVGSSHTSAAQQDLVTVLTSDMNAAFIVTPVNGSQKSWNKSVSCAHNRQTGSETFKRFLKRKEDDGRNEMVSSESAGREGELSSSDLSCRGSSGNECISVSSGEMVIRSHSFCLEEQSLTALSSLEDSSISPAASCVPSESNLLSATLPDVCKTSTERRTKQSMGHRSLGETFTLEKSTEKLAEEDDAAALSPLVPLPSESEGGLFMTFICESPTDQTQQAECCGAEAEPRGSEGLTPELGKTFMSTISEMLDSDDDVHTSTPVQSAGSNMPKLSYVSPCIENANNPGLQLAKKQQTSASSKGRPVAGVTPSLCKVKKADSQKAPKSDVGTARAKVLTRMSQQAATPGAAKPQKPPQVNKSAFRTTPARVMSRNPGVCAISKPSVPNGQANERAAPPGVTVKQLSGPDAASSHDPRPAVKEHAPTVQSSKSSFRGTQASVGQVSEASAQHAASLSCASRAEKSPARSGRVDPKPTPRRDVPSKTGFSSGSASGQDRPNVSRTRSRCFSESTSISRPPKEKKAGQWVTASFTAPRDDGVRSSARAGSSQHKHVEEASSPADSSRGAKKISLVAEPSRSTTAGAALNNSKGRAEGQASPRPGRGAALTQPPAARPSLLPGRQIQGALQRAVSRISRTVGNAQRNIKSEVASPGSHRAQATEEPSVGMKLQQNASKAPQTPSRPSLMGPPLTPAVKLPRKFPGLCQDSKGASVSGGALQKPTVLKSFVLKARLLSTSAKNSGSAVTTACRSAASTSNGSSASAVSPLKKTNYGKPVAQTPAVDRSKPKTSSRQPQQQYPHPAKGAGSQTVAQGSVLQDERRDQNIQQLKELLTASNRRFQALAVVLQQTLAERDEATRQCGKLSEELVSLKGELACSVHSSECLQREKEELRAALQDATRTLQEEHQKELAELEQRLQAVYKAECDSVLLSYKEEAKKYKTVMQQQMEDLKADHEALKLQLESSHAEELQSVRQQYEMSMEELRKVHTQEMLSFEQALKDAEAAVSAQIQELTVENNVLLEKLAAEESRRRELGENTQKDSHTLYLEKELESLKVVLDLKNKQLHQQEKKLLEIGKLTERNVKLDEFLIKVQQENEDLKARMERHAALSRQLSTEQAVLQESLQKESKVNKRLSMENEELLWKLHNGDLSSPRRVSPGPTSPSHPFKLQSPRSSVVFSSPPVSPR